MNSALKRSKGFTLVELLVVISIIAILSVIGITLFSGVQKNARDAKRRSDIDTVAKAMEINYGKFEAGQYSQLCRIGGTRTSPTYDCKQWFGGGVPTDPGAYNYGWCDPNDAPNNPVCRNSDPTSLSNTPDNGAPDGRSPWMVCAILEAGGKYCRNNQQ